jgi:hypothetical protein
MAYTRQRQKPKHGVLCGIAYAKYGIGEPYYPYIDRPQRLGRPTPRYFCAKQNPTPTSPRAGK